MELKVLLVILPICQCAMICDTQNHLTLMKWPEQIQSCDTTDHRNVTVLLERTNNHEFKTRALSLQVKLLRCTTKQQFFGSKEIEKTVIKKILPKSQYEDLMKTKSCIDSTGQLVNSAGTKSFECPVKWMTTVQTDVVMCTYREGYIAKTHTHQPISDLADVSSCKYDTGYCYDAKEGIAVTYTPDPLAKLKFLPIGKFNGSLITSHLIIPKLGLSFVIDDESKLTEGTEVDGFRVTATPLNSPLSAVDDIKPLLDEITHKLQFLEDSVLLRTAKISNMCDALQMISMLIKTAASRNPTEILRHHFNDTSIIGVASNSDYILIGHCTPVTIRFRRPTANTCTNMIPISYQKNSSLWEDAFMSPDDNVLHKHAAQIPCDSTPVHIFTHDKVLYRYHPGHMPERLNKHLAVPLPLMISNYTSELVTFPSSWSTTNEDVSHTSQSEASVKFIANKLDDMEREVNSHTTNNNHDTVKGFSFLGLTSMKTGHIVDLALTWVVRIIVLYLFVVQLKTNGTPQLSIPRIHFRIVRDSDP